MLFGCHSRFRPRSLTHFQSIYQWPIVSVCVRHQNRPTISRRATTSVHRFLFYFFCREIIWHSTVSDSARPVASSRVYKNRKEDWFCNISIDSLNLEVIDYNLWTNMMCDLSRAAEKGTEKKRHWLMTGIECLRNCWTGIGGFGGDEKESRTMLRAFCAASNGIIDHFGCVYFGHSCCASSSLSPLSKHCQWTRWTRIVLVFKSTPSQDVH